MRKGDKFLTPDIAYTNTKVNIEAYVDPIIGMRAVATDTREHGFYTSSGWIWGTSSTSSLSVEDEGVLVSSGVTVLNFVGDSVIADEISAGIVTITISGLIGPSGAQGLQGETGPSGVQGLQGEIGPSGVPGSGIELITFLDLIDTPSTYSGYMGQAVIVNDDENGLEFIPFASGYTPPVTAAENDFQVGGVGGTLGTWVTKTLTQIKALFKSYFDTIYQPVAVNYAPTVITFGNAVTEYDINGTTWVASTAGIPDVAGHLVADALTAIAVPYDSTYLAIREHSGAASATNPLTVQFTFPSVTTFNVIKFRVRYAGSVAHEMIFELYNGATWDIFDTFTSSADYQLHSHEVLVPASYVIASTVLGRFRHLDAGVTSQYFLIDFIIIGSGGGSGGDSIQSAHQTPFLPAGSIVATDVQAAIEELDASIIFFEDEAISLLDNAVTLT